MATGAGVALGAGFESAAKLAAAMDTAAAGAVRKDIRSVEVPYTQASSETCMWDRSLTLTHKCLSLCNLPRLPLSRWALSTIIVSPSRAVREPDHQGLF